jgi:hypothetical protein
VTFWFLECLRSGYQRTISNGLTGLLAHAMPPADGPVRVCAWQRAKVAWLLLAQLLGVAIFGLGFFLTRFELPYRSTCLDNALQAARDDGRAASAQAASGEEGSGCWFPRRFDRAVVIVIDALRLDFAYSAPSLLSNRVRASAEGCLRLWQHGSPCY